MEFVVVFLVILFLGLTFVLANPIKRTISKTKKDNREKSITIVQQFIPGNSSFTLTELIQYHRQNGVIEYKVDNNDGTREA